MRRHDVSRPLGRGINFGNALDAAPGRAAFQLAARYFDDVREAGFSTVRLPVRWSAHAGDSPPYAIDPAFFQLVDWAIGQALGRDLNVVVDLHHYHELNEAPSSHGARFLALWSQIAAHYANWPSRLHFELLNEPHGAMTAPAWNQLLSMALSAVRKRDTDRPVIVGPVQMNDVVALPLLTLPEDDHLVVTVHYYAPFEFTHQGAPWIPGASRWMGSCWRDDTGRQAVHDDLAKAAAWAKRRGRPLFIGEFGTYAGADMDSRQEWTRRVRVEAERLGASWCYWDFGTDFGAFDLVRGAWRPPLKEALLSGPVERPGPPTGSQGW